VVLSSRGMAGGRAGEERQGGVPALARSDPAYFFRLAGLWAEAAAEAGLDPAVARQLAAQTLAGAGRLVSAETTPDLAAMRAAVTSKGGTTAAALAHFDGEGFARLVTGAMRAATERSRELAAASAAGK